MRERPIVGCRASGHHLYERQQFAFGRPTVAKAQCCQTLPECGSIGLCASDNAHLIHAMASSNG
jgi:hypothetical protein